MPNILLISYDNGSHIPFFPQNIWHLVTALRAAGHSPGIWFQDIHHGHEKHLTRLLDNAHFDIVGLGFVAGYYQYRKAKEICHAINKCKARNEINLVLGGHGPAAEPDYFLRTFEADTVVVGDGERGIVDVAGSNRKGVIQSEPCSKEPASLGAYNDFPMDIYRLIRWPTSTRTDFCFPILSSRGCKWHCSFCYRMRDGFYMRPVESIIDEVKYLHNQYQINHFQFSDELLMASVKRTEEICEAISRLHFKIKWDCNGRLNFAKPEIMSMMRTAGCEYVNYGIESLDQTILNQMGKGLTVDQIHAGVKNTLASGMSPGLNLIWGFPGDTVTNLQDSVNFLIKYDPCHELRTIRPVSPYPGTPLYRKAIDLGLLEGVEDFYEHKHVNSDLFTVNFMDMTTEEAHKALCIANHQLIENYYTTRAGKSVISANRLYMKGDTSFRGFRNV